MIKKTNTVVANRRSWVQPVVVRMDAADAENMTGTFADMMGNSMMNS